MNRVIAVICVVLQALVLAAGQSQIPWRAAVKYAVRRNFVVLGILAVSRLLEESRPSMSNRKMALNAADSCSRCAAHSLVSCRALDHPGRRRREVEWFTRGSWA